MGAVLRSGSVALGLSLVAAVGLSTSGTASTATVEIGPVLAPPSAGATASAPPGEPVVVPLDRVPGPAASPSTPAASLQQQVGVSIVGGALELPSDLLRVELTPAGGGRWEAELPEVRVVDARGTHAGWVLRWAPGSVSVVAVRAAAGPSPVAVVEPGPGVVVAGLPQGLRPGAAATTDAGGGVLLTAEPGTGGGTYAATGRVVVVLPADAGAQAVTVELELALR